MNEKEFIDNTITKIQSSGLKNFPSDFYDPAHLVKISIPVKTLMLGKEFFGTYEVITTDGSLVYQADTLNEARFFIYCSANRNGITYLPEDKKLINQTIEEYHHYLDNLIAVIISEYKKAFPDGKDLLSVSNKIFQKLNIIRY
ncbi:MAG: hypothetical protein RBR74_07090 [Ignavibacteriaceae bacterium]|nr:hypothetical protein [Ignavibacteriaceae bacterium]